MPRFLASKASRRAALGRLALGTAGTLASLGVRAQTTDRPLTLVVPFPPGGSTDIVARLIQPKLSERLGRPVVVENKPGAASQIATQQVARAAPDGHTVLVSFDNHALNPVAKPKLPYDTFKDFAGVSLLVKFPLVLGAHPSVPGSTLRQFLDRARTEPSNRYNYASTGVGSLNHLVPENLRRLAGVEWLHVPYGGGGPAVQAVLSNTSQMTFLSYAALRAQIQAGRIKALAVTGARRLPDLPDVPTVGESGFPGFEAYSWIGVFAPAATPAAVVQRLTADVQATLADPDVRGKLTAGGFEVIAGNGEAADRHARAEYERWSRFVRESGLKLDE